MFYSSLSGHQHFNNVPSAKRSPGCSQCARRSGSLVPVHTPLPSVESLHRRSPRTFGELLVEARPQLETDWPWSNVSRIRAGNDKRQQKTAELATQQTGKQQPANSIPKLFKSTLIQTRQPTYIQSMPEIHAGSQFFF